ncbi:MAG TPA: hypothetical protein VN932_03475 [Rhizomicrobium sp.]|nr:hypothetical protein [Rhizomicrobium sp.]
MKSVLFGWELGANLGHAKPLASIANQLRGDGVRIVVAARDLLYARVAFAGIEAQLLQAPIWPDHRHFGSDTGEGSYLDILVNIGFADRAKLAAVVAGWIALLDLAEPDAIVADHSPALLLAARIRDIPVVQVGSGYTMPPVEYDRLPPIRADRAAIVPESRVASVAAGVAAAYGAWAPQSLLDIFRTRARIVFGCPELDVYAPFRREPLCLPPEPLPEFIAAPVEPRLFVYLGPDVPGIDQLLQVLTELNIPLEAYLRGEAAPLGQFLTLRGHRVHDTPPALADVLPNVSHVLSAGGVFTCHAALAAGRPLLGLPQHGEALLNITALEKLGSGRRLEPWSDEKALRNALLAFLRDHTLLRQAQHWAKVLGARHQPDGLQAAAGAIRQCLGMSATGSATAAGAMAPQTNP